MADHPEHVTDAAHDILRPSGRRLDAIFAPRTVAVVGASEQLGSVGRALMDNLMIPGAHHVVFPVNRAHQSILGVPAYASLTDIREPIDLAVIATPAATVPAIIHECVEAGVRGVIIISAGFREGGSAGALLEQQVLREVRESQLRVLGANCLGVMRPHTGFNATFATTMALPGRVAFVSQSGALCTAVLDWSLAENVGFSAFISIGTMIDVGWGDILDFLSDDLHTESILLYMETVGQARSFLSAAREAALTKPIIVLKPGRTAGAAQAAVSHTGALTGSDAVLDAAFDRAGVLRVETIAELFYTAEVLAKQPRPAGPRLTIVTNAGGPAVLAADALIESGGQLAPLSDTMTAVLNQRLPNQWSHGNPIDVLGDAAPERYHQVLDVVTAATDSDGLLVIVTPQAMTDPASIAETLASYSRQTRKPILASWMGGAGMTDGIATLHRLNIPTFPYPDTAARMFTSMWHYTENLRNLYETPTHAVDDTPDREQVARVLQSAVGNQQTLLDEAASKELLAAYGIPTVLTRTATSEAVAVAVADELGYPVVLKLRSSTIAHKSDVNGVQLNVRDGTAVRRAYRAIAEGVATTVGAQHFNGVTVQPMVQASGYELIIGSSIDAQFGPVLLFGAGGELVEVWADHALGLPPLTTTLAHRMIERTRIAKALHGIRGRPAVNLESLAEILVRLSYLVIEQPRIKEIDINPLLATPQQIVALDARVVLYGAEVVDAALPRPAIRPYPVQYMSAWSLKDGRSVTIRPIRPEDERLMVRFHATLSERSVYLRYFAPLALATRAAHTRLTRMCFIDYDREIALVVVDRDPGTGEDTIIAVGRLIKLHDQNAGEFAILISDQYQGHGLGTELLRRLVRGGRDEGLQRIVAEILPENRGMQRVATKLGFQLHRRRDDGSMHAELDLAAAMSLAP